MYAVTVSGYGCLYLGSELLVVVVYRVVSSADNDIFPLSHHRTSHLQKCILSDYTNVMLRQRVCLARTSYQSGTKHASIVRTQQCLHYLHYHVCQKSQLNALQTLQKTPFSNRMRMHSTISSSYTNDSNRIRAEKVQSALLSLPPPKRINAKGTAHLSHQEQADKMQEIAKTLLAVRHSHRFANGTSGTHGSEMSKSVSLPTTFSDPFQGLKSLPTQALSFLDFHLNGQDEEKETGGGGVGLDELENTLFFNARKVVKYYTNLKYMSTRHFPLTTLSTTEHANGMSGIPSMPALVLMGPQLCHSLLTTAIFPYLRSNLKAASSHCDTKHVNVDAVIEMSLLTIKALGHMESQGQGQSTTSMSMSPPTPATNGVHAEEILRCLLSIPCGFDDAKDEKRKFKIGKELTHVFNSTLNVWASVASNKNQDPVSAREAALRAEHLLLDHAMSQQMSGGDGGTGVKFLRSYVDANTVSFNTVLKCWASCGRFKMEDGKRVDITTTSSAERGQGVLNLMQDIHDQSKLDTPKDDDTSKSIRPDRYSYDFVIRGWGRAIDLQGPRRAMEVLDDMLNRYQSEKSTQDDMPFPSSATFSRVLKAWSNSSLEHDASTEAIKFLEYMKMLEEQNVADGRPDTIAYNSILSVLSKQNALNTEFRENKVMPIWKDIENAYSNGSVLDELVEEMTSEGNQPDLVTHGLVLNFWLKFGKFLLSKKQVNTSSKRQMMRELAERAEKHLLALIALEDSGGGKKQHNLALQIQTYLDLMSFYRYTMALRKVESVFHLAQSTFDEDTKHYQAMVQTYSSHDPTRRNGQDKITSRLEAGKKAQELLNQIERIPKANLKNQSGLYNGVIDTFLKHPNKEDGVQKADMLLTLMVGQYANTLANMKDSDGKGNFFIAARPNNYPFVAIMNAYNTLCGNTSNLNKCEYFLKRLEHLIEEMNRIHSQGEEMKSIGHPASNYIAMVVPIVDSYNKLLHSYSKVARKTRSEKEKELLVNKAEDLVSRIEDSYKSGVNQSICPDKFTYGSLLNIIAESKIDQTGERTERVLKKAVSFSDDGQSNVMDIHVLNTALKIYVFSREKGAALKAESLLQEIENGAYERFGTKADRVTYSSVMSAFAHLGTIDAARKVEDIFFRLQSKYETTLPLNKKEAFSLKPDSHCFMLVMTAWAKVGSSEAWMVVEKYLDNMVKECSCSDSEIRDVLNAVMKNVAESSDELGMEKVEKLFQLVEENTSFVPDEATYRYVMCYKTIFIVRLIH